MQLFSTAEEKMISWKAETISLFPLQNPRNSAQPWRTTMSTGQYSEGGAAAENKVPLNDFSNLQPVVGRIEEVLITVQLKGTV